MNCLLNGEEGSFLVHGSSAAWLLVASDAEVVCWCDVEACCVAELCPSDLSGGKVKCCGALEDGEGRGAPLYFGRFDIDERMK